MSLSKTQKSGGGPSRTPLGRGNPADPFGYAMGIQFLALSVGAYPMLTEFICRKYFWTLSLKLIAKKRSQRLPQDMTIMLHAAPALGIILDA